MQVLTGKCKPMCSNIRFDPWLGDGFSASAHKILILGESHYNDAEPNENQNFTDFVVKRFVSGAWNHRFFTGISRVLSGLSAWETRSARKDIWQHLAFYNYIQEIVAKECRLGYSREKVIAYHAAFKEVIEQLAPHYVLVFSKRLWLDMEQGKPLNVSSFSHPLRMYEHSRGRTIAIPFCHPSGRGFKAQEEHNKLQAVIQTIR
jgi:hypothetical protein